MTNFKLSGNFWTVLVFAIFLGSAVYLWIAQPAIAPAFTAVMLPFAAGIIGNLQEAKKATDKIAVVDAKVEQVAVVASASAAVSLENAQSIAAVGVQTNHGLEGVNQKVDGHLSGLTSKIDELMRKVATLEKDKAVKELEAAHTETNTDKIIAAVQTAVSDAAALAPPAEPTGLTPAYGTPVGGS